MEANSDSTPNHHHPIFSDGSSQQGDPSPLEIRKQLDRMLESELFERSPRMSRFLRHVVEAGLDGREEDCSEYAVALDVFDRAESFDPRFEPIVRVEAGRLRNKIRAYYATVGRNDLVAIGLRRRGYRPLAGYRRSGMSDPVWGPLARQPDQASRAERSARVQSAINAA